MASRLLCWVSVLPTCLDSHTVLWFQYKCRVRVTIVLFQVAGDIGANLVVKIPLVMSQEMLHNSPSGSHVNNTPALSSCGLWSIVIFNNGWAIRNNTTMNLGYTFLNEIWIGVCRGKQNECLANVFGCGLIAMGARCTHKRWLLLVWHKMNFAL